MTGSNYNMVFMTSAYRNVLSVTKLNEIPSVPSTAVATGLVLDLNFLLPPNANETPQDGTKDGTFSWTCPQVNPYSDIYFYQFVSPLETSNPQWTTRFAIASSSGATSTHFSSLFKLLF